MSPAFRTWAELHLHEEGPAHLSQFPKHLVGIKEEGRGRQEIVVMGPEGAARGSQDTPATPPLKGPAQPPCQASEILAGIGTTVDKVSKFCFAAKAH